MFGSHTQEGKHDVVLSQVAQRSLSAWELLSGTSGKCILPHPEEDQARNREHGRSIAGRGGPWGWETPRLPLFVDSRLTDGAVRVGRP
jgi:hypothetical protein